jgi:hypothetical protein
VGPPRERSRGVPRAPLSLTPVARVVAISADLLLGSKVEAMLTAAGHEVVLSSTLASAPLDDVKLIVADLDAESPEALVATGIPVLGYYSHVDVKTRKAAEAAGIALVVPRSRMARELPELATKLLER